MARHSLNFGIPSIHRRRIIAQILFFSSGVLALFLFGGVEVWAKGLIAIFLAGACFLEVSVVQELNGVFPRKLLYGAAALLLLLLISLIPVPIAIAEWIYPGQVRLLKGLPGLSLKYVSGSMAPLGTVQALVILLGASAVCYLSWLWADESFFRRVLIFFILVNGGLAALIGFHDVYTQKSLLYSLRSGGIAGAIGPFVNRNHFSNYVNFSVLLGLGVFIRYGFPRLSYRKSTRRSLFGLCTAFLCAGLSIASLSRGGILSLFIGVLVFVCIFYRKEKLGKALGVTLLILLLGGAVTFMFGKPAIQRLSSMAQGSTKSDDIGRLEIWSNVSEMTRKLNGAGSGAGTFEWTFPIFQTIAGHRTVTHAESEYFHALAEWGILGCAVWGFLLFVIVKWGIDVIRGSPKEWEIAGWAALSMMGAHMFVDFPLHISANAWVTMALLGILMRGHYPAQETAGVGSLDISFRRWFLILVGLVLAFSIRYCFSKDRDVLERVRLNLEKQDYAEAGREAKNAIGMMPFYWRAHEYAAHAAAGTPGFKSEVLDQFKCAQLLSRANPRISLRAGLLFLNSEPALAREFFEEAIQISPQPLVLFKEIATKASEQSAVQQIIPLAMRNPDRWLAARQYLNVKQELETSREAADYWLNDLEYRQKVLPAVITGGQWGAVLKSFQRVPPRNREEAFYQARTFEFLKQSEQATRLYSEVWKKYGDGPPQFEKIIPLTPATLEKAVQDPKDQELQWNIAETLFASSQRSQSIQYWERSISYKQDTQKAWYALAVAYQELGETSSKDYFQRSAEFWRLFLIKTWNL